MNRYDPAILDKFVYFCTEIFAEKLTGVYLHGSMAMGCFHPQKSDIDLLVLVRESISDGQKKQFMDRMVELNERAPRKGLELSVIKEEYCRPFLYPTPFELHFSPVHLSWFCENPDDYIKNMNGTDRDLAAHIVITKRYGKVLYGKPIEEAFGDVPRNDYIDSIYRDISDAQEAILEDGVYVTLNLCRVLAFVREGLYLSKEGGARWGLKQLPEKYCSFITSALNCYRADGKWQADAEQAKDYAHYMLDQIEREIAV